MATPNLSSGASIASTTQRITRGITQSMLNGNMVQPPNGPITKAKIGQYQFPSDLPKYYFGLGVNDYNRVDAFSFSANITDTIKLPLPKQLADTDHVEYEQKEIGTISGALAGAGQAGFEGDISGAFTNIIAGITGGISRAALDAFSDFSGLNSQGVLQASIGSAPNMFTTVLLKGPAYKKHEFTWTLSPRNHTESNLIRRIIVLLKNSMFVGSPMNKGSLGFFTAPKIFVPHFFTNEFYLYKFKPCVLENMSVNYTPSGAPAFYSSSGAPDTVELRLSFLEVEFWFSGQYV